MRGSNRQHYFEILSADGTPVATILALGMQGGLAPPGTPTVMTASANYAIIGGTGAFLGVRGQAGQAAQIRVARPASVQEDPSRRRVNGVAGSVSH